MSHQLARLWPLAPTRTRTVAQNRVCPPRYYVKRVEAIEIITARPCDAALKASLIKPPQTSRTKESTFSPAEILRHATGEEQRVGYNALRALLSLWKEATQVLLTQGLLPEIAFWSTWLSGIWNEPLMDTEVILCPCGPFIAFKLSCLYSSHHLFFLPAPFWSTKASFDAFHPRCFNRPCSFSREGDQWSRGAAPKIVHKPSKMEIVSCLSPTLWG